MARPSFGPVATRRIRHRQRVASGKGITIKRDGVRIEYDTDPLMLHIADAAHATATAIGREASARAPDATPYGVGLVDQWGVGSWAFGRLVQVETGSGPHVIDRPRDLRVTRAGVDAVVGFSFPGRFQEVGTVHHGAQPFLGPAAMAVIGSGTLQREIRSRVPKGDDE